MLLFLCSVIIATAAGVTAFLVWVSGDFNEFRESFTAPNESHLKQLPLVTREGQIIDTKEELEAQLELLQYTLEKKKSELDSSRNRIFAAADSLQKLTNTSTEVKKYYLRLTGEIQKYETECQQLQQEVDEYKKRKFELEKKMIERNSNYEEGLPNLDTGLLSNNNSCKTIETEYFA